jgi:hypothetical protein
MTPAESDLDRDAFLYGGGLMMVSEQYPEPEQPERTFLSFKVSTWLVGAVFAIAVVIACELLGR